MKRHAQGRSEKHNNNTNNTNNTKNNNNNNNNLNNMNPARPSTPQPQSTPRNFKGFVKHSKMTDPARTSLVQGITVGSSEPEAAVSGAGRRTSRSSDLFNENISSLALLFPLVSNSSPRVLEVGLWEGRSSVFILTELCNDGGEIICIDHFDHMGNITGRVRYNQAMQSLEAAKKPFRLFDEYSVPALTTILREEANRKEPGFDWVYIDGSHAADDTLLDGELAWRMARKGAVVIFDNYSCANSVIRANENRKMSAKKGIDSFLSLHEGEFEQISQPGHHQMILRKTSDMRLGFQADNVSLERDFANASSGINIVFTVSSEDALPCSVAIRSILEVTPGTLNFFLVDCGLDEIQIQRLRKSATIPGRTDVSLKFVPLMPGSMSTVPGMSSKWAKLDIVGSLKLDRVLYLNCDILVRSSIAELYNLDLGGRPVGAVVDVGMPLGHEGPGISGFRTPYFNAGVMLMDLNKIRQRTRELQSKAWEMRTATLQDQDVLNAHFRDNWCQLALKWNAQGLGTYASMFSFDRRTLKLDGMRDPCIVHFTGPLHPSLEAVLNPYVQPFTAKPWGYAGAPGHPYEKDWWKMLDKTPWAGWPNLPDYDAMCAVECERAIRTAITEFRQRLEDLSSQNSNFSRSSNSSLSG